MTKLKGLLLTEGMHGMISQVEGLAKALDLDFIHEKIELNNFWKLFPPKLTPVSSNVYKKVESSDFDVIISCGRKSVIPSIHLKKNSNKRVINIHIQNPKVNFKNFDFIVAPEHDGITGENVINTKGAIHYLSEQEIHANKDYLGSFVKKDTKYIRITHISGSHPVTLYILQTDEESVLFELEPKKTFMLGNAEFNASQAGDYVDESYVDETYYSSFINFDTIKAKASRSNAQLEYFVASS